METISNFVMASSHQIKRLFQVEFLDDAVDFLSDDIWEFRTRFSNKQYRILAFWDRRDSKNTLIICSHGFIKKTNKAPDKEIMKAEKVREKYFK